MAINVNTVYTTVLSILNKEQRGYLTPYEFNKAATQSQLDIFEKYFIDLDAQLRIPQNDFDYSNPLNNLDDVVSTFRCFGQCPVTITAGKFSLPIVDTLSGKTIVYNDQPASNEFAFYRLGTVNVLPPATDSKPIEIERLQRKPFYEIDKSDLTTPSVNYPVYLYEGQKIYIKPTLDSLGEDLNIQASFLRKPRNPVWGFTVNSVGAYIYDPTVNVSVDFEISSNDQTELILQILQYAGVVIRDPQIVQVASQELAQE
tara:strand:+ start:158 stop:931 length:774 start_codon:yes stop_codon:yes gene_type:complete